MTTMSGWIAAFAEACGQPVPDPDTIDAILELAGTAAHASVRQTAPVTCWMAAAAGLTPAEAGDLATRLADELDGPGGSAA